MIFSITILGSSSATPTSSRNPTSILVNINYKYFLVDCGEGTQIQLRRFKIKIQKINHIFISHLHGDHFFGLIGLISTYHLLGRDKELHIYANPAIEEIINLQLTVSGTRLLYPLIFHPIDADVPATIFENKDIAVKTFPLNHSVPTTGFLFIEKERARKIKKNFILKEDVPICEFQKIKNGADYINPEGKIYLNEQITVSPPQPRSFAFCSDTSYFEPVIPYIRNVDLLYHEATFMKNMANIAAEKYHSTADQAASIAKKANVKNLILGHFSARYRKLDDLLTEAQDIFPNTHLAEDGKIFRILREKRLLVKHINS